MTGDQVTQLMQQGLPAPCRHPEIIETHISWVLACEEMVYKIKKPVNYSFLDFTSLEQREFFCHREVELNRRLTSDMYLDVIPVRRENEKLSISTGPGDVVDYAVCMRKIDGSRQMDLMLRQDAVSQPQIDRLAQILAAFHRDAQIVREKDYLDVKVKFNAIGEEVPFVEAEMGREWAEFIRSVIIWSDEFLETRKDALARRLRDGWFRDVHGDLHTRNIFLLPEPVIFDCIEFSDDYRQIDLLSEVAFLCMDIEAHGHPELAAHFMQTYNAQLPVLNSLEEYRLFHYYKAYRANVMATVNSISARYASDTKSRRAGLEGAARYLKLLRKYATAEMRR